MKIETKHILIAILLVFISVFGYFFLVYRPQAIKLQCMEVAKDLRQKISLYKGATGKYGSGETSEYFINQEMYNDCIKKTGLGNKNNGQE